MNLFGCKFCEYSGEVKLCDRKNFDSLLWATVTVFQVSRLVEKPLEFEPQTSCLQDMCSTTVLTIAALPSHIKGSIHSKTTILMKVT